ncbi:hypothetical protein [Legionella fairfieldensis]|uniref:hypothetical protein n=1 Tax=Legionella fairfieldensis TaxID=45064 RepID=UPI0004915779|nr:hypothetical protein [Legionella fairfieldensis]
MPNKITENSFLCENSQRQNAFSTIPSNCISIERLLNNQPAFIHSALSMETLKKKTLVFLPLFLPIGIEKDLYFSPVNFLINMGFSCIYFNSRHQACFLKSNDELKNATSPPLDLVTSTLIIPRDEMILMSEEEFSALDSLHFTTEFFTPYHTVVFDEKYVSFETLQDLFHKQGNKIKSLTFESLSKENQTRLAQLLANDSSHIGQFDLSDLNTLHINSCEDSHFLSILLKKLKNIETLYLYNCNTESISWEEIDFTHLKKISLTRSVYTNALLHKILIHGQQLEEVYLSDIKNDNLEWEKQINLSSIKKIDLSNCENTQFLQAIVARSNHLEELNLYHMELDFSLKDTNFSSLLKLELSSCTIINSQFLQTILAQSNCLKELDLRYTKLLKGDLNDLDLSHLIKFNAQHTQVNNESLHAILVSAKSLQELVIDFFDREIIPDNAYFRHLKTLTILGDPKNKAKREVSLQEISTRAPYLEALSFGPNCEMINGSVEELDFSHLRHLTFGSTRNGDIQLFLAVLTKTKVLHTMKLANSDLGEPISLGSIELPYLTTFSAEFNRFSCTHLQCLLGKAEHLEELKFVGCGIKDWDGHFNFNFNFPHLKKLEVSYSQDPTEVLIEVLVNILKQAPHIRTIELKSFKDEELEELLEGLLKAPIPENAKRLLRNYQRRSTHSALSESNSANTNHTNFVKRRKVETFDADTSFKKQTYNLTRQFIGSPYTPEPSKLRLRAFNALEFTNNTSAPFLLRPVSLIKGLTKNETVRKSTKPLKEEFSKLRGGRHQAHYLGIFSMNVNKEWQPIPSVSSEEELKVFYTNSNIELEFSKNPYDGFYYVRAPKVFFSKTISLQIQLDAPLKEKQITELPVEIQEMIKKFRNYKQDSFDSTGFKNGKDFINAIVALEVGACRHRGIAFKDLMTQKFPYIPVNIIDNDCHFFAEVFYNDTWVRCDLGGYPSNIVMNEKTFDDLPNSSRSDQLTEPTFTDDLPEEKNSELQQRAVRVPLRREHSLSLGFNLINHKANTLITTSHPENYAYHLQELCQKTKKPVFYISDPQQLKCSKPFIEKQDNNTGIIRKGPGGALYDFMQANPEALIIIDYSRFTSADIVQFNGMYDKKPHVDGVDLPCQLIGIINPEAPDAYKGADFYSRFDQVINNLEQPPDQISTPFIDGLEPNDAVIELAGIEHFNAHLKGCWTMQQNQLIYQPGKLEDKLSHQPKRLVLKNPPIQDPEFQRFVHDFKLNHPQEPELLFYQAIDFEAAQKCIQWSLDQDLPDHYFVLNPGTLSKFLGDYLVDKEHHLTQASGLIESFSDENIPIYLTVPLSRNQWYALTQCAKAHHKNLVMHVGPQVTLLESLNPPEDLPVKYWKESPRTQFLIHEPEKLPQDALVIDISELDVADLLPSVNAHFEEQNLQFHFTQKPGFLEKKLKKNRTVVLKGEWTEELKEALHPLLAQRFQEKDPAGTLIIIGREKNEFPSLIPSAFYKPKPLTDNPVLLVEFADRQAAVEKGLAEAPFIFLKGVTGVGKTSFIQKTLKNSHQVLYGEQSIEDWLNTSVKEENKYAILFIDEANITHKNWSCFQGLFNNPPAIFHQGKYYPLSAKHKVIFAGNPATYGGERREPKLFENPHPILEFLPIPLELLSLPNNIKPLILELEARIKQHYPNQLILTPREYLMIRQLAEALYDDKLSLQDLVQQISFDILKNHIPSSDWPLFAPYTPPGKPLIAAENLQDFTINDTNEPALRALSWQLGLRKKRCNDLISQPGLGGLVLEGQPGIGKSDLLIKVLVSQGLREPEDFIHIPVSLGFEEKTEALLNAFHQGKIVIIDEINSSPMLERLLNALLEGHDLANQPAKQPGFLLLGTQNPISFKGRKATTLPIKHRLQHVYLQPYSLENMIEILIQQYSMPQKIAREMVETLIKEQKQDPSLCFRDLLRWAKHWQQHQPKTSPIIRLTEEQSSALKEWVNSGKALNYQTHVLDINPEDYYAFLKELIHELQQGNLPLVTFARDEISEYAGSSSQNPVQTAFITGYLHENDEIILTDGREIFHVDAATLFKASLTLAQLRF